MSFGGISKCAFFVLIASLSILVPTLIEASCTPTSCQKCTQYGTEDYIDPTCWNDCLNVDERPQSYCRYFCLRSREVCEVCTDYCGHNDTSCGCTKCAACEATPRWRQVGTLGPRCIDSVTLCTNVVEYRYQKQSCVGSGTGEKCDWVDADQDPGSMGLPAGEILKNDGVVVQVCASGSVTKCMPTPGGQYCGCTGVQGNAKCYLCPDCEYCGDYQAGPTTCTPWCDGTDTSCGCNSCMNCDTSGGTAGTGDGWYDVNTVSKCIGGTTSCPYYKYEEERNYYCSGAGVNSNCNSYLQVNKRDGCKNEGVECGEIGCNMTTGACNVPEGCVEKDMGCGDLTNACLMGTRRFDTYCGDEYATTNCRPDPTCASEEGSCALCCPAGSSNPVKSVSGCESSEGYFCAQGTVCCEPQSDGGTCPSECDYCRCISGGSVGGGETCGAVGCTDSDGGVNLKKSGYCMDGGGCSVAGECADDCPITGDSVTEWYCYNDKCTSRVLSCDGTCSSGACIDDSSNDGCTPGKCDCPNEQYCYHGDWTTGGIYYTYCSEECSDGSTNNDCTPGTCSCDEDKYCLDTGEWSRGDYYRIYCVETGRCNEGSSSGEIDTSAQCTSNGGTCSLFSCDHYTTDTEEWKKIGTCGNTVLKNCCRGSPATSTCHALGGECLVTSCSFNNRDPWVGSCEHNVAAKNCCSKTEKGENDPSSSEPCSPIGSCDCTNRRYCLANEEWKGEWSSSESTFQSSCVAVGKCSGDSGVGCRDDDGNNPNVFNECLDGYSSTKKYDSWWVHEDYCSGDVLYEQVCSGGRCIPVAHTCGSNGCSNGACAGSGSGDSNRNTGATCRYSTQCTGGQICCVDYAGVADRMQSVCCPKEDCYVSGGHKYCHIGSGSTKNTCEILGGECTSGCAADDMIGNIDCGDNKVCCDSGSSSSGSTVCPIGDGEYCSETVRGDHCSSCYCLANDRIMAVAGGEQCSSDASFTCDQIATIYPESGGCDEWRYRYTNSNDPGRGGKFYCVVGNEEHYKGTFMCDSGEWIYYPDSVKRITAVDLLCCPKKSNIQYAAQPLEYSDEGCNNGLYLAVAEAGTSLKNMFVLKSFSKDSPIEVDLEGAGIIETTQICFDPIDVTEGITYVLKEGVLSCNSTCSVGGECQCTVRDCKGGMLLLLNKEGQPIDYTKTSVLSSVKSDEFSIEFAPAANGTFLAMAICTNNDNIVNRGWVSVSE